MDKRIPGWITGAFLFALCMLVIYGSGCKEGNNSTPISMTISGIQATTGIADQYTGSFSLSGYVKNNDLPVVNLPVELLVGDQLITNPVSTTGEGQFFFSGLAPALYTLRVGRGSATYTEMLYPVYINSSGVQSPADLVIPIEELNPTISPASGTIEAYVVDSTTNNPVLLATASLAVYSSGVWVDQNRFILTDGSGYFSFANVLPGLYMLKISKTGYALMEYPVNIQSTGAMSPASPRIPLTFISATPTITGTISGYAKDPTGAVLPQITVSAKNAATGIAVAGSPRITTTLGKFSFENLLTGEYTITASGIGYTTVTRTSYIMNDGSADPPSTDLILAPITAITGTLIGYAKSNTGSALPEVTIAIRDKNTSQYIAGSPRKTTSEGKYVFESVPPGDYEVSATLSGYSTATRTCYIRANGTSDPLTTEVVLTRATDIKGNITGYAILDITRAKLPEITVKAVAVSTGLQVAGSPRKTTSEGKYTFYDLPPGEYSLTASGTGYTTATRTAYIKDDGTADPLTTDLVLSYSMTSSMIEGYVVDSTSNAGIGLADIALSKYSTVTATFNPLGMTTVTNGSGYFSFSGIDPGLYLLNITKTGYVAKEFAITIKTDGTKEPAMPRIGMVSIAQAITGNIVGTVKLNTTGQLLPEITVSLKDSGGNSVFGSPVKTTGEGKFAFYGLEPDQYTLTISEAGYTPVTRTCYILSNGAPDPATTNITLSRITGSFSGYVRLEGTSTPLPQISVNVRDSAGAIVGTPILTTAEGKYLFENLDPDTYTLNASSTGYTSVVRTAYIREDGSADPTTTTLYIARDPSAVGTITGFVRLASTSAALPEIDVRLLASDGVTIVRPTMKTTADGKFLFENLPPETYEIFVPGSVDGVLPAKYQPVTRTCYVRSNGTVDPAQTTISLTE